MLVFIVQIHFFPNCIVIVIHDVSIYNSNSFPWGILIIVLVHMLYINVSLGYCNSCTITYEKVMIP